MFLRYNLAWIAWALFILVVCVLPAPELPSPPLLSADKLFHSFVYAFLAFLASFGFHRQSLYPFLHKYSWKIAGIASALYGVLIEFIQAALPYRSMDVMDMAANAAGCAIGCIAYLLVARPRGKDRTSGS